MQGKKNLIKPMSDVKKKRNNKNKGDFIRKTLYLVLI